MYSFVGACEGFRLNFSPETDLTELGLAACGACFRVRAERVARICVAIKCLSPFGSSDASSTFCARPGREGQSRALQRSLVQRLIMAPESEGSGGPCGTGLRLLLGMLCDRGHRSSDGASAYSGALDRLRAAVGGRLSCNTSTTTTTVREPHDEGDVNVGLCEGPALGCNCAATPAEKGNRLLARDGSGVCESGSELKEASSTRPPSSARSTRMSTSSAEGRGRALQREGHCGRRVRRHRGLEPRCCGSRRSFGLRLRPMPRFRRGRVRRNVTRRTRRWALHRGRRAADLRQDFVASDASGLGFRVGVSSCVCGSRTLGPRKVMKKETKHRDRTQEPRTVFEESDQDPQGDQELPLAVTEGCCRWCSLSGSSSVPAGHGHGEGNSSGCELGAECFAAVGGRAPTLPRGHRAEEFQHDFVGGAASGLGLRVGGSSCDCGTRTLEPRKVKPRKIKHRDRTQGPRADRTRSEQDPQGDKELPLAVTCGRCHPCPSLGVSVPLLPGRDFDFGADHRAAAPGGRGVPKGPRISTGDARLVGNSSGFSAGTLECNLRLGADRRAATHCGHGAPKGPGISTCAAQLGGNSDGLLLCDAASTAGAPSGHTGALRCDPASAGDAGTLAARRLHRHRCRAGARRKDFGFRARVSSCFRGSRTPEPRTVKKRKAKHRDRTQGPRKVSEDPDWDKDFRCD